MKKTSCEVRLGLCYLDGWDHYPASEVPTVPFTSLCSSLCPRVEVYQCFHSLFH